MTGDTISTLRERAQAFDPDHFSVIESNIKSALAELGPHDAYTVSALRDKALPDDSVFKEDEAADYNLREYLAIVIKQDKFGKQIQRARAEAPPEKITLEVIFRKIHHASINAANVKDLGERADKIDTQVVMLGSQYAVEEYMTVIELQEMIQRAAEQEYDTAKVIENFIVAKDIPRANITGQDGTKQHNCWHFAERDGRAAWHKDTEHFFLIEVKPLAGMQYGMDANGKPLVFKPASRAVKEAVIQLAARRDTLHIDPRGREYRRERAMMKIDPHGSYFDIHAGTAKPIDPQAHFYEHPDLGLALDMRAGAPEQWFRFLEITFGKEGARIVDDFCACAFLPSRELTDRQKALFVIGPIRTWKTFVATVMREIWAEGKIRDIRMQDLVKDALFVAIRLGQAAVNVVDELPRRGKALDMLKSFITAEETTARGMHSTDDRLITMPWWYCNGNVMVDIIAQGEDEESVIDRMMIVETRADVPYQDWRKLILKDTAELQRIMMHWLKRAAEIRTDPESLHTQSRDITGATYKRLITGNVAEIVNELCIKVEGPDADTVGFDIRRIQKILKFRTKRRISIDDTARLLAEAGFDAEPRRRTHCIQDADMPPDTYRKVGRDGEHHYQLLIGYRAKSDQEKQAKIA